MNNVFSRRAFLKSGLLTLGFTGITVGKICKRLDPFRNIFPPSISSNLAIVEISNHTATLLPDRWDDPIIMARIQKKYDDNSKLFNQIINNEVNFIDHTDGGGPLLPSSLRNALIGIQMTSLGSPTRDSIMVFKVQGVLIYAKGILFAHERLFFNNLSILIGFIALLVSNYTDTYSFIIIPIVLGFESIISKISTTFPFHNFYSTNRHKIVSCLELEEYLDEQFSTYFPVVDISFPNVESVINGEKNPLALLSFYLGEYNIYDNHPAFLEQSNLLKQFIYSYYNDEEYPVFSGVNIIDWREDFHFDNPEKLLREAMKTKLGFVPRWTGIIGQLKKN